MNESDSSYTNEDRPATTDTDNHPSPLAFNTEENRRQRREFLEALFGNTDDYIDIRLIKPDGPTDRLPVPGITDALEVIEALGERQNVHFGMATRRTGGTAPGDGGKKNLAATVVIWVDIDFKRPEDEANAEALIAAFPIQPSIVVHSGGGLHLYWLLEEPFDLDTPEAIERFEPVLKGLTDHSGADRAVAEASHVLRVPGTINFPNKKKRQRGRVPALCRLLSCDPSLRYRFEDFAEFAERGRSDATTARVEYEPRSWDGTLPDRVQEMLEEQMPSGNSRYPNLRSRWEGNTDGLNDTSDSGVDMGIATLLAAKAVEGWEIEHALRYRRSSRGERPKPDQYYIHTTKKAKASIERMRESNSTSKAHEDENLTDLGNARRFVRLNGEDLRFCHQWKKWLVWDGRRWALDEDSEVIRRAASTIKNLYAEASQCDDSGWRRDLASHAKKSENEARIRAMVSVARVLDGIPIAPKTLDQDSMLLNVSNGTIDLRTGELRPHNRADLITKCIEVSYDPSARSKLWERFLERVIPDASVRVFVQRAIGYSLTGLTVEQVWLILWGMGANGKTKFLEALLKLLSDYALKTPSDTLLAKRDTGIPNDVARLPGRRFVVADETEEGRRLAESRVKELTGGDTIAARFMRGEWFDFQPVCKLWMATNHKPVVRGTDYATWRRMRLIPFVVTIPEGERDEHLGEKLAAELPGILAWAVEGCLAWQQQGLKAPDAVLLATETYRKDEDVLGVFLDECCILSGDLRAGSGDLYKAYLKWCERSGEKAESQKKLAGRFEERGLTAGRVGGGKRIWRGIGLKDLDGESDA